MKFRHFDLGMNSTILYGKISTSFVHSPGQGQDWSSPSLDIELAILPVRCISSSIFYDT